MGQQSLSLIAKTWFTIISNNGRICNVNHRHISPCSVQGNCWMICTRLCTSPTADSRRSSKESSSTAECAIVVTSQYKRTAYWSWIVTSALFCVDCTPTWDRRVVRTLITARGGWMETETPCFISSTSRWATLNKRWSWLGSSSIWLNMIYCCNHSDHILVLKLGYAEFPA